ncbi:hypothetical protein [Labilibacter marinus]|uniref:hypothetical protein n=1 Tax=Labilibacter marinus TaxID=1477105 RepID=UPI000832F961|nr:hypothetical protein [Labilibacter marinus]
MNHRIGNISNYLAGLFLFIFGIIYLFKPSFMPYHSQALSLDWSEVDHPTQILILALMRVVSAGYIAGAIVIITLQRKFSSSQLSWIPALILIFGLIVGVISIYGTFLVRLNSPGKPPIETILLGIVLVVIGYIFNKKSLLKTKSV